MRKQFAKGFCDGRYRLRCFLRQDVRRGDIFWHINKVVPERGLFASEWQYIVFPHWWIGNSVVTQMTSHSLINDDQIVHNNCLPVQRRCAAIGASSYCHPCRHANVNTPCLPPLVTPARYLLGEGFLLTVRALCLLTVYPHVCLQSVDCRRKQSPCQQRSSHCKQKIAWNNGRRRSSQKASSCKKRKTAFITRYCCVQVCLCILDVCLSCHISFRPGFGAYQSLVQQMAVGQIHGEHTATATSRITGLTQLRMIDSEK